MSWGWLQLRRRLHHQMTSRGTDHSACFRSSLMWWRSGNVQTSSDWNRDLTAPALPHEHCNCNDMAQCGHSRLHVDFRDSRRIPPML